MAKQLSLIWRVLATALCFFAFGLGGLILRVLVFPLLGAVSRNPDARIRHARLMIRWAFRGLVEMMRVLGVLRYEVCGLDRLRRGGLLILANHPTLIDTVFLMAFVDRADCIVKSKLWNNPFTYGPVRAAGYIRNDDGPELVERCVASLEAGNNLIIFPEGTRTPCDGGIRLRRGAANIAVRGMRDITPVVIRCTPRTLGKDEPWWRVPAQPPYLRIEVQEDIVIRQFLLAQSGETLAARHLTYLLQDHFTKETRHHAAA